MYKRITKLFKCFAPDRSSVKKPEDLSLQVTDKNQSIYSDKSDNEKNLKQKENENDSRNNNKSQLNNSLYSIKEEEILENEKDENIESNININNKYNENLNDNDNENENDINVNIHSNSNSVKDFSNENNIDVKKMNNDNDKFNDIDHENKYIEEDDLTEKIVEIKIINKIDEIIVPDNYIREDEKDKLIWVYFFY